MIAEPTIDVDVASYRHGRVPRPVRERQIRSIAAELFRERGYAGTSMEEIARRSGLSRPVVYDLAGSKAELFRGVLESALNIIVTEVTTEIASSTDIWQGLRAGLTAFFRFADTHPAEFDLVVSGSGDPDLDQSLQTLRTQSNQHIADLLAALARESDHDMDPRRTEALAHAVQGATDYVARWRLTDAPDLPAEQAATWVAELLEPGLRAQLITSTPSLP